MPSEQKSLLPTQTEKPIHYTYLKEFRVEQCPLFLQHKCTQHRPFTCFHWHFMNQRRRRPVRKRDGTFNYSPDVYCTKFDETTGICPDGDECPFLHRTAGDTERRYHLRYYKTGTCVYETDARGHCVKNGPHCAFAHGAQDLRPPVYDIRELASLETGSDLNSIDQTIDPSTGGMPSSVERERNMLNEDPKWQDANYVLANYKTEPCKRPPRLCRQGYACPSFHNTRDRRRSPKKFKYRSTPCPNVKHGDDWGEPNNCENGDNCPYCHTRTEQQFHPEIYKSTKCNDMQQTGYCPRGPFCAFAHVDQEIANQREMIDAHTNNLLSTFIPNTSQHNSNGINNNSIMDGYITSATAGGSGDGIISGIQNSLGSYSEAGNDLGIPVLPPPIAKPRSQSSSSSISDTLYQKAPGSEREDSQASIRKHVLTIDNDPSLSQVEKAKRKQNLYLQHNFAPNSSISNTPTTTSVLVPPFYATSDTVGSVIGNALDDIDLEDFNVAALDKEYNDNDSNSVSSSLSTSFANSNGLGYMMGTSAPMNIPASGGSTRDVMNNLSQSPPSPLGSYTPQTSQEQRLEQAAVVATFMTQSNIGKFGMATGLSSSLNNNNKLIEYSSPTSSSVGHGSNSIFSNNSNELQQLREELITNRAKLASWEEGMVQARNACDAWKREAEESIRKAKVCEQENAIVSRERDEAVAKVRQLEQQVQNLTGGPHLHVLNNCHDIEVLPLATLKQLQLTLKADLDRIESVMKNNTTKCMVCDERQRSVAVMPCNHYVLCEACAAVQQACPYCQKEISQKSTVGLAVN